jgi:hydrogenase-4 component F
MMAFGLLSVVVAAFFLLRQKSLKRLFAYSSIEHVGLMTFAFGLGGVGSMAGLLHMTTHTLAKSAAFFAAGEVIQKAHTQTMGDIRGVIRQIPGAGWGLMFAGLLLAGIPPSGIFLSEFMMLGLSVRQAVWTLPFMLVGLGVGFAAIVWKIQEMVFGEAKATSVSFSAPLVWIHLVLAILLGFYIPPYLLHWYREAAKLLG